MKVRILLLNVLLACMFFVVSIANAESPVNTSQAEQLEKGLFKAVMEKNWVAFDGMVAPGFQSVNQDKIRNRSEAIEYVKSLQFENHSFSDFHVSQDASGKILVISYEMTYDEKAGNQPRSGKKVKNLSVWENNNGKWQWLAHAVID